MLLRGSKSSGRFVCWFLASLALLLVVIFPTTARAAGPCCTITGIDSRTGIVNARVNVTGQTFQFAVKNSALLSSLKVGQGVYANFGGKQVSLDGRAACCAIVSIGAVTAPAAPPAGRLGIPSAAPAPTRPSAPAAPPAGRPGTPPTASAPTQHSGGAQAPPQKALGLGGAARIEALTAYTLPTLTAGTPRPAPPRGTTGSLPVDRPGGRPSGVNSNVVHLRGIEDIKQAQGLPEGAKNLLLMHALTLPPEEVDHYIVNRQLAEEWIRAHPVPASVKPANEERKKKGKCDLTHSEGCAQAGEDAGQHVADEASRQVEKLRQQAGDEWKHVSHELAHDWSMGEDCFADKKLDLPNIPVQFTLPNEFTLRSEEGVSRGSASGNVKGTVTIGLPVTADFKADLTLFYIPCLPFAIRPRSLGADGNLSLGTNLGATLNATGAFSKSFRIPPGGGPHFPIEVIPIVVLGVPVAEMDVSIYIDGTVDVDAEGELDAHFKLNAPHETAFVFECNGHGCAGAAHRVSQPITTSEDAKVSGRVHVKPKFYAALQLDFDVDALSARAGPEPYLLGELYGCGAASATQSTAAATTTTGSYALTADLDWGLDLRAEALVGGKQVGNTFRTSLLPKDPPPHLKFWDLAGSTALVPGLEGVSQVAAGSAAAYKIRMPTCYPYTQDVEYRVSWSGGATATNTTTATAGTTPALPRRIGGKFLVGQSNPGSGNTSACTFEAGQAHCWGNPGKDVPINLVWPAMGNNSLSITLLGDKHHRVFTEKERATHLDISVQ